MEATLHGWSSGGCRRRILQDRLRVGISWMLGQQTKFRWPYGSASPTNCHIKRRQQRRSPKADKGHDPCCCLRQGPIFLSNFCMWLCGCLSVVFPDVYVSLSNCVVFHLVGYVMEVRASPTPTLKPPARDEARNLR